VVNREGEIGKKGQARSKLGEAKPGNRWKYQQKKKREREKKGRRPEQ